MKTTLELPDALMRQIKVRAALRGKKLKDEVADLLQRGLKAGGSWASTEGPMIATDEGTGLPVLVCAHRAIPGEDATPERIAAILLGQESERFDAAR